MYVQKAFIQQYRDEHSYAQVIAIVPDAVLMLCFYQLIIWVNYTVSEHR